MLPLRIYMMVLIPTECFYKSNWIEHHHNHCSMIKDTKPSTLLLGDSIVASLRYLNVWNEYFTPTNVMNLGIGGCCVENALWGAINLPLPSSMKNVVILCGTNNIPIDTPCDIADCIISIGCIFQKRSRGIDVSVCDLILRDKSW